MEIAASTAQPDFREAWRLAEMALTARDYQQFTDSILPAVAKMMQSPSVMVLIPNAGETAPDCLHYGLAPETVRETRSLCAQEFDRISGATPLQPCVVSPAPSCEPVDRLAFHALRDEKTCVGLIGLTADDPATLRSTDVLESLFSLLANAISRLLAHAELERQVSRLNTYLTVISMLSQELGLHELLEMALYCCMEATSAETASVLLLDEEKRSFRFYQVEGPAKPILETATFPADRGLAGSVLESQQSEIIHDARNDPRFYGEIDTETGLRTRNMIVVPLTAGAEQIGVLEVLNKADGGPFTEEERLVLLSISDEIAFAIRNAKVFEYVVNSYCKQRQGQNSCRGCKRPLGSWTPCVKYREAVG